MAHVTVVLPTHRRPDSLRRVTAGLARQEDPGVPWDVVIVENDDTSTASAAVLAASEQLPVASSVVLERVLGASSARNRGIAEASGSIVAFIDDDVVPDDDWLKRLVEPVLAGRCDAVGGQVALDPTVPVPGWIPRWLRPYLAEFQPAAGEIDLRDLAEGVLVEPYVLTANAAFTADVLARAGGFDPLLGPRRGVPMVNDDVGLSRKVLALGASMRYVPDARVVHELPPSRLRRRYLAKRLYAQGRSDWLLDRGPLAATRTAGAHTATVAFAKEVVRDVRAGTMPRPQHTFLWCQAARRAGFLRESLAELARRRQRRSRGPS
jgi:glycosyltransferase involved in cell wall biosynthesis